MAAEAGAGEEGAFEVEVGGFGEAAKVGTAQGFWSDANFEGGGGGKGGYC